MAGNPGGARASSANNLPGRPATPSGWTLVNRTNPTWSAEFSLKNRSGSGTARYAYDVSADGIRRIYTVDPILRTRAFVASYDANGKLVQRDDRVYNNIINTQGNAPIPAILDQSRTAAAQLLSKVATSDEKQKLSNTKEFKSRLGNSATAPPARGKPGGNGPAPTEENPGTDTTGDTGSSEGSSEPQFLSQEEQEKSTNIPAPPNIEYSEVLRYPINYSVEGDYIQFTVWDYQKSGLNAKESQAGTFKITRMRDRIESPKGTVILPIQSGISDVKSTAWADGQLNPITAQFGNLAYGTISRGKDLGNAGQYFLGGLKNIGQVFTNQSDDMKQLITNYFVEQALSGSVTNALSRTAGAAINNNVELLFGGAQLRSFTFNFKLTPRDKPEAERIRKIIRLFKREMTPRLSTSGLFLLAPRVFTIKYIYSGTNNNHPYLNKIGVCALRDFGVDYTPDGNYMTYADGGSMTQYSINMTFGEIDPIYASDYDEGGDNQENPTSMGY